MSGEPQPELRKEATRWLRLATSDSELAWQQVAQEDRCDAHGATLAFCA